MNIDEIIFLTQRIKQRDEDNIIKELMMVRIRMLSIHDPGECLNVLEKIENRYKLKKELTYDY